MNKKVNETIWGKQQMRQWEYLCHISGRKLKFRETEGLFLWHR